MKTYMTTRMPGTQVLNPHKNTANCKKVNDRLRRLAKRRERAMLQEQLRSGDRDK